MNRITGPARLPSTLGRLTLAGALLLGPLAGAQTTPAAPPRPAPVTTPAAATLRLNAPVGTSLQLALVTESRVAFGTPEVTAAPGKQVTPAALKAAQAQYAKLGREGVPAQRTTAKMFVKVAGRAADGTTTLITSMVQSVPGLSRSMTMRITQKIAPNGQLSGLSLDSDDPQVNRVLAGMNAGQMADLIRDSGGDLSGAYGLPLQVGAGQQKSVTIDLKGLFQGMFSMLGPEAARALGGVQATPVTTTTTTRYAGLNAQGLHVFNVASQSGGFRMSLGGQGDLPLMVMELSGMGSAGTVSYRADGLPGPMTQQTTVRMAMTMQEDNVLVKIPMTVTTTLTAQTR